METNMKLVRYGNAGNEKPGILDRDGFRFLNVSVNRPTLCNQNIYVNELIP